jgi:hypothetical protein
MSGNRYALIAEAMPRGAKSRTHVRDFADEFAAPPCSGGPEIRKIAYTHVRIPTIHLDRRIAVDKRKIAKTAANLSVGSKGHDAPLW